MSGSKKSASFSIKKAQYYVWYLGWKECRGLGGREFTEPIVKELVHRRSGEELPKLTIEVSKKELKIVQLVENRKGKIDKVKYPPVLSKDVTYAVQALSPDEDVVACIFLGYNPHTKCAVHVHVYRCDSVETARLLVNHLNQLAHLPEHMERARRIEEELANKGQVVPRPGIHLDDQEVLEEMPKSPRIAQSPRSPAIAKSPRSPRSPRLPHSPVAPGPANGLFPGYARDAPANDMFGRQGAYRQNLSARDEDEEQIALYDSLAEELKHKLGRKPLLLPAKDYDTINRVKGNQFDAENRKCMNVNIVGQGAFGNGKLESTGGTDDSARGDSESSSHKNSQDGDLDVQSGGVSDPSPRSLKSSGRFSAGFGDFDQGRNTDEDPELAGLSTPPVSGYNEPRRPFSPGPFTQDLKKSYFGDKTLPGYLPNSKEGAGSRYNPNALGLTTANLPNTNGVQMRYGRQRSQDEGYTSLERRSYPHGRKYEQEVKRSSAGLYPPAEDGYGARGPAFKPTHLRRQEPEPYEEPPIDYTIAVRNNDRSVPHSNTLFR